MNCLKNLILTITLLMGFCMYSTASAATDTVEKWDVYEITLEGPESGNPFTEVELMATFSDGTREMDVRGFYDGDGVYKIRFMPDKTGDWRYVTQSNAWDLTGEQGRFEVTPATGNNHGPVEVVDTYHFQYRDETPYYPFGTTTYNWLHRPDEVQEQTLETLADSPFNKLRMLVFPEGQGGRTPPELFPFQGSKPDDWNYDRFNPEYFRQIEERIEDLRELNVEADLILFHKYGSEWGLDNMRDEVDDRYLRYIVARLAAYRNVWWSMANEYDFVKTKTEEDWDRYFQIVQKEDPYNHLRSIHNGFKIYDHNKPWVTHASIQNGAAVEESGRAQMYRDVWEIPVVYDEVKYEGDVSRRWGQLSPEEMVHRFWAGTVAGTYVGHGECYLHPSTIVWLSTGGVLRGDSPERIQFLRDIVEDMPGFIDPIDKWQATNLGGVAGKDYILYFGRNAPEVWSFRLPDKGLEEGQEFEVQIIDTYNMEIEDVETTFVLKRKDRYAFVDAEGRSVKLPGEPYYALRIRRK